MAVTQRLARVLGASVTEFETIAHCSDDPDRRSPRICRLVGAESYISIGQVESSAPGVTRIRVTLMQNNAGGDHPILAVDMYAHVRLVGGSWQVERWETIGIA